MERNEKGLTKVWAAAISRLDFKIVQQPDVEVPGSEGTASWFDYAEEELTFGKTATEQRAIDQHLLYIFGMKLGYDLELVRQVSGNGHCTMWFKKKR